MQSLNRFRYAVDMGEFIDMLTNKSTSEKKMREHFEKLEPGLTKEQFEGHLKTLTQLPLMRKQITSEYKAMSRAEKADKPSNVSLTNDAYLNLREDLEVHYHIKDETLIWYFVDDNNEVHPCSKEGPEGLELLLMRHKELKDSIEREFNKDENAQLRATLSFEQFVRALYSRLKFDSEKQLDIEPPPISWDFEVPAFKQLNPALLVEAPTPTWDQFTSRLNFPDHFRAFVWSIFEPRNKGRQALYLYGAGFDGKSSAFNAVANVLGDRHTMSIDNEKIKNTQFFYGNVYSKRLVLYPDCKVTSVLRHEVIKSMLGGDKVQVNRKNRDAFSSTMHVKLMIGSNRYPRIDVTDKSERTRLMFLIVDPIKDNRGDHMFEANLRAEIWPFLVQCKAAYEQLCPTHSEFELPLEMQESIRNNCNAADADALEDYIEEQLEFGADYYVTKKELKVSLQQHLMNSEIRRDSSNSVDTLQVKLSAQNVKSDRVRLNGGPRLNCFVGIRLKGTKNSLKKDNENE